MPIELPVCSLPQIKMPPAPRDPPVIQDLANAVAYDRSLLRLRDLRKKPGRTPTKQDVGNAHVYLSRVTGAYNAAQGDVDDEAPAWFTRAMEQVHTDISDIRIELYDLRTELHDVQRLVNRMHNHSCGNGNLRPFLTMRLANGQTPEDANLPHLENLGSTSHLTVDQLDHYLHGYGLMQGGTQ
ncbi:hypothetical protein JB92DRAFT_2903933 [Gautieria morchelliformis]|nr:hypothetical protein JB92DRAFT_2903933 [Gautieria morchelliformis]